MIKKLNNCSSFTKNVLTLMTGTTVAQAIPIAISPILTRIYTPSDFGLLALFIAITAIFGNIANAKYELAIMLPKKDEDAINILAFSMIIAICISLFLLIIVFLFSGYITELLGNKDIEFWLYFIPITVLFLGLFNSLNYYNIRKKYFKDIAKAVIIKSIVMASFQLTIGFLVQGVVGLISGEVFSKLFANLKLARNILKDKVIISKISKPKMIALAKKYKGFFYYNTPASLVDSATLQMPFIFIIKIANEAISGYFFLASKIVMLPSALIGSSIAQVFFQQTTEHIHNKELVAPLVFQTMKKLVIIALPITVLIILIGPHIFGIIFGKNWGVVGTIAQYVALIFFIRFVVSSVSQILSIKEYLKRGSIWKYMYFFTSVQMYTYAIYGNMDFYDFMILFVIHEYVLYLIYLYLILKSVRDIDSRMN
ncbi:lipopolysaccharide biosynthesis protein [Poseidonibacter ostreae]|uniref:Oligosaccharide flippase family protein n=1 Tax=Poseidonibacter ostreae TaxID=2654171 RepID=A0A6L4WU38_9BACT|nr:oligosaccharide flippase family protein [Poseidonibacter ostreae]KAB7889877.1 oligosaccharide flippase family protein [Poseidonibacter ostreae]KAB7890198.1 oligosaccharide flippase family protein [Poseidonibacter ostreae]